MRSTVPHSVIKRNIDSTPVYRVIHIHGGWRLCLFASVGPFSLWPPRRHPPCPLSPRLSLFHLRSALRVPPTGLIYTLHLHLADSLFLTPYPPVLLYLAFPPRDRIGNPPRVTPRIRFRPCSMLEPRGEESRCMCTCRTPGFTLYPTIRCPSARTDYVPTCR